MLLAVFTRARKMEECLSCLQFFDSEGAGVSCALGHFACVVCFNAHVRAHLSAGELRAHHGRVQCVEAACHHKWSLELAADPLDKATAVAWAIAMRGFAVDAPMEKAQREAVLAAAQAAALRAAAAGRAVALRLVIADRDLNLRCPRCALVFVDYRHCNALTCSNAVCRAAFCAVCLEDCGADA